MTALSAVAYPKLPGSFRRPGFFMPLGKNPYFYITNKKYVTIQYRSSE